MSQPDDSQTQQLHLSMLPSRLATGILPDEPPSSSSSSSNPTSSNPLAPSALASSAHRLAEGRMPCARRSYLLGIGTAIGVGTIQMFTGKPWRVSANWGAGSFVLVSVTSWEMCRRSLAAEHQRMKTIIHNHQRKSAERGSPKQSSPPEPDATPKTEIPSPPPSRLV